MRAVLVVGAEHVASENDVRFFDPEYLAADLLGARNGFELKLVEFYVEGLVRHVFLDVLDQLFRQLRLGNDRLELLKLGILAIVQVHEPSTSDNELLLERRPFQEPLVQMEHREADLEGLRMHDEAVQDEVQNIFSTHLLGHQLLRQFLAFDPHLLAQLLNQAHDILLGDSEYDLLILAPLRYLDVDEMPVEDPLVLWNLRLEASLVGYEVCSYFV